MRRRLEKWCRKHRRPLVFWGSFIVFATFVMKEGFHEYVKGYAETVERTEQTIELRSDHSDNIELLFTIQQQLRSIGMMCLRAKILKFDPATLFRGDLERTKQSSMNAFGRMEILKDVLDTFPQDDPLRQQAELLRKETFALADKFEAMDDMDSKEVDAAVLQIKLQSIPEDEVFPNAARKLTFLNRQLLFKSVDISNTVVAEAKAKESYYEKWSDRSWVIAGLLYALGWSLGLFGKLYGVPDAAGGD